MNFRRILVPVDFSECSSRALDVAVDLAARYGAELELLHVWFVTLSIGGDSTLMIHQLDAEPRSLAELVHDDAEREMKRALDDLTARGVRAHGAVVFGDPALKILEASRKFDVIVMGTHGRGALQHALFGSVAERVVRRAECPVLTVRAPLRALDAR